MRGLGQTLTTLINFHEAERSLGFASSLEGEKKGAQRERRMRVLKCWLNGFRQQLWSFWLRSARGEKGWERWTVAFLHKRAQMMLLIKPTKSVSAVNSANMLIFAGPFIRSSSRALFVFWIFSQCLPRRQLNINLDFGKFYFFVGSFVEIALALCRLND